MPRGGPRPMCSIEKCGKPHVARGLCSLHYSRWRQHGDPLAVTVRPKSCVVTGCDRSVHGHGLCSMHHDRLRRSGDVGGPSPQLLPRVGVCSEVGCSEPDKTKGLCQNHYKRYRYRNNIGPRCTVAGCDNARHDGQFCGKHYQRVQKYGYAEWPDAVGGRSCALCVHPNRLAIEAEVEAAPPRGRAAIARKYGISYRNLTYHFSVLHAERLARMSLVRLERARRLVQ